MEERKTIHKWLWVWDFEKEERWLNTMALEGWVLESVGFCTYHFRRCEPGEYILHLELRGPDPDYLRFMEDCGVHYIGRMAKWIYFSKPSAAGGFDLSADLDSRLKQLNNIARMLTLVGGANILIGLCNVLSSSPIGQLGVLNLLGGCLLCYALGRIHSMREPLQRERELHE